jgi:hypothetical protein
MRPTREQRPSCRSEARLPQPANDSLSSFIPDVSSRLS